MLLSSGTRKRPRADARKAVGYRLLGWRATASVVFQLMTDRCEAVTRPPRPEMEKLAGLGQLVTDLMAEVLIVTVSSCGS